MGISSALVEAISLLYFNADLNCDLKLLVLPSLDNINFEPSFPFVSNFRFFLAGSPSIDVLLFLDVLMTFDFLSSLDVILVLHVLTCFNAVSSFLGVSRFLIKLLKLIKIINLNKCFDF